MSAKKKPQPTAQRWVIVSDLHCGATTGLTSEPNNAIQKALFARWADAIAHFGSAPDVVICNGDAIDGLDRLGRDIDETSMFQQAQKAADLLAMWQAKREYVIISGTPYHVGADAEEMERAVVSHLHYLQPEVKSAFTRKWKCDINGWFRLDARHKIGRSNVPYGKSTAQVRAKISNVINAAMAAARKGKQPEWPHLTVFSHVHYYNYQEDSFGAVMSTPSWLAYGSRYGDTECEGWCDVGAVQLVIQPTEEAGWQLSKRLYPASMVSRMEHR